MVDYFASLGEIRRPWLDEDHLKQRFLAMAAETHPDRVHLQGEADKLAAQQRYASLNTAYQCLREPKDRLRHLLELECGARPRELQEIPPALMNLFLEVGALCRQVDAFLSENAAVASPLLKVQMFERGQEWTQKLIDRRDQISKSLKELTNELRTVDEQWQSEVDHAARQRVLGRLEELYRLFSYFGRWQNQIQERIMRLVT